MSLFFQGVSLFILWLIRFDLSQSAATEKEIRNNQFSSKLCRVIYSLENIFLQNKHTKIVKPQNIIPTKFHA